MSSSTFFLLAPGGLSGAFSGLCACLWSPEGVKSPHRGKKRAAVRGPPPSVRRNTHASPCAWAAAQV